MGFDNTTENAEHWQITIIESLIPNATLPAEEIEEIERMIFDTELKADKAAALIEYLKDNSIDPDPRKQFEKRF